jgi:hypothetical protein
MDEATQSKLPEKCTYADKYHGYIRPKCGCLACLRKYNEKEEEWANR